MGLKKRNKVNAEFSMSSLTDIIFLLLIFFMLTATFVRIEPFELITLPRMNRLMNKYFIIIFFIETQKYCESLTQLGLASMSKIQNYSFRSSSTTLFWMGLNNTLNNITRSIGGNHLFQLI